MVNPVQFFSTGETTNSITDIAFIEDHITKVIGELKYKASPGPDNILAVFFKNCRCTLAIAKPLYVKKITRYRKDPCSSH